MADMRVNRYAKFDNAVEALDDYVNTVRTQGFNTTTAAITAKGDLLARIRELILPAPRTVTAEQWEGAVRIAFDAMLDGQKGGADVLAANRWLDRIIDALGIADTEPVAPVADAPHQCADVADDCCKRQPVADAPTVEEWQAATSRVHAIPEPVVESCTDVDVDVPTLQAIAALSDHYNDNRVDRFDVVMDGGTEVTFYRDDKGRTRVVIGGAL